MPVPQAFRGRFAYHFCHIDNLPSVLEHGLLSCTEQRARGIAHLSVAEQGIQQRRAVMQVTCGPGGVVHDYVPFYFCRRSSMLMAVVQAKNVDQQMLVYFSVPIELVERNNVVFTSAAANTIPPPTFLSDPDHLVNLDWEAIDSLKWSVSPEAKKQARMAEMLVHSHLAVRQISHIIVWNEHFRERVSQIYNAAGIRVPEIRLSNYHYLTQWPEHPDRSLVMGPILTKATIAESIKGVQNAIGTASHPEFATLAELRDKLRDKPASVPLVNELFGLKSDNPMHRDDVGQHTIKVAELLRASSEWKRLVPADQLLCEIAAYFHDVGKGPKSRWKVNDFRQKADPDHPVTGVEYLAKYLPTAVSRMKPRSVRVTLTLVGYHDLIGDILGRGRKREQILNAAIDVRDIDMLIALAKADVCAINPGWWNVGAVTELRRWVQDQLAIRNAEADGDDD
jgi:putative nucleotidyltransferase with HDIG domain